MESERKELPRADVLKQLTERLDRIERSLPESGDIMIDAYEAAAIAYVESNTIFTWGANGVIPRYKLGGAVRFGLREFCQWVASCRQPSLAENPPARREKQQYRKNNA